jgi:hypothetical protein
MKPWLLLTLVLLSVGGGCIGIVSGAQIFTKVAGITPTATVFGCILIAFSAFTAASGLLLAHEPRRTGPIRVALGLQVPYIYSPIFSYKMFCGVGVYAAAGLGFPEPFATIAESIGVRVEFGFGGHLELRWQYPWCFGVDLVAIFFLMALCRPGRKLAPDARQSLIS